MAKKGEAQHGTWGKRDLLMGVVLVGLDDVSVEVEMGLDELLVEYV
jgi:hypothetical protein